MDPRTLRPGATSVACTALLLAIALTPVARAAPTPGDPSPAKAIQKAAAKASKRLRSELEQLYADLDSELDDCDETVDLGLYSPSCLSSAAGAVFAFQFFARNAVHDAYLDEGFFADVLPLYDAALSASVPDFPKAFALGSGGALDEAIDRISEEVDRAYRRVEKRLAKSRKRWENDGVALEYVIEPRLRRLHGTIHVSPINGFAWFVAEPPETLQVHTIIAGGRLAIANDCSLHVQGTLGAGSGWVTLELETPEQAPISASIHSAPYGGISMGYGIGLANEGPHVITVKHLDGGTTSKSFGLR